MSRKRIKFKDWREARRKRAFDLHEQGRTGRTIAQALGVSETAVSRWLAAKESEGRDAWRATCQFKMGTNSLVNLGRIALRPSKDRGVIHIESALFHHLFNVAVRELVAAVPADT